MTAKCATGLEALEPAALGYQYESMQLFLIIVFLKIIAYLSLMLLVKLRLVSDVLIL